MISFAPFSKKTISVPKTLINFSKEKNISIKSLDFTLETYETLVRRKGFKEDLVLEDITKIDNEILYDKDARIYQRYTIKIFPSDLDISKYKITLASNKQKTKVIAVIKAGSLFVKDQNLHKKLLAEIWHKKLSAGFLIGIFEEGLQNQLQKLIQILPYGKKLSKDIKFVVAKGVDPIDGDDGQIQRLYLAQDKEQPNYIDGVKTGALILRYKKAQNGHGGRSCDGIYLPEKQAQNFTIPEIDDTVVLKENDEYIEFYANDNGFVEYENDTLKISKTLKLEGADYKSTGHLDAKELKDEISVNIQHNKEMYEDAIGAGLKVDIKDLKVDGSIGANVQVAAQSLNIDAQTHKKATFTVQNKANIKLHRGDLIADNAEIEVLETGKITAHKSIHVKKVVGGELIAPKVYIEELVSNAKVIASELIEIKSIKGSNNILMINPDKVEAYHKEKEHLLQEIEQEKEAKKEDKEFLEKSIKEHSEEIDRIKTFQRRVNQANNSGKTPMKQDILRIKEYKRKSEQFEQKKEALAQHEEKIKNLEESLKQMLEQDLYAQIKTNSLYDGHTRVVFVNPENFKELAFLPKGRCDTISLELDNEGNRQIKKVP